MRALRPRHHRYSDDTAAVAVCNGPTHLSLSTVNHGRGGAYEVLPLSAQLLSTGGFWGEGSYYRQLCAHQVPIRYQ